MLLRELSHEKIWWLEDNMGLELALACGFLKNPGPNRIYEADTQPGACILVKQLARRLVKTYDAAVQHSQQILLCMRLLSLWASHQLCAWSMECKTHFFSKLWAKGAASSCMGDTHEQRGERERMKTLTNNNRDNKTITTKPHTPLLRWYIYVKHTHTGTQGYEASLNISNGSLRLSW